MISPSYNRLRPAFLLPLALFACLSVPLTASAAQAQTQNPSAPPAPRPQLKVSVELVKVDVSVTNARGKFIEHLSQENFRVLDDGVDRPISYFASIEAPAQVLVLVEVSPAVFLIHREHLEAAYALLQGLGPDDRAALATYAQAPKLILPFTTDKSQLAEAMLNIEYVLGMADLNFYDSVSACLDWLEPVPGKKALILLTTGLDSSPPGHWESLAAKLRASQVTIFPVALGGTLRSYKGKAAPPLTGRIENIPAGDLSGLSFETANQALRRLAGLTGGRAYFPKSAKEFIPIYRQIAAALRHEYTIGFAPAHDRKFHTIQVQVFDTKGRLLAPGGLKPGYQIFARQGYRAPGAE